MRHDFQDNFAFEQEPKNINQCLRNIIKEEKKPIFNAVLNLMNQFIQSTWKMNNSRIKLLFSKSTHLMKGKLISGKTKTPPYIQYGLANMKKLLMVDKPASIYVFSLTQLRREKSRFHMLHCEKQIFFREIKFDPSNMNIY